MQTNFSLMIPTRNRVEFLYNAVSSIFRNTEQKELTEVIIMYDNDDNSTPSILEAIKKEFSNKMPIKVFSRERSFNMSDDYFNYVANNIATGKYLIALNDDIRFIKYSWDVEAIRRIDNYLLDKPDGIFYGVTDDREVERKRHDGYWFSCFPLVSKKAIEALGFFFDPYIWKDGADWDLLATYKNIDRVLDLRAEIIIEHISTRSGRRGRDILDDDNSRIVCNYIPKVQAGYNTDNYNTYLREYIASYGTDKYKNTNFLKLASEGTVRTNKPY